MKDAAVAALAVNFKRDMIQFQGFMSFLLLSYWLHRFWPNILDSARRNNSERLWLTLSLSFGVFFSLITVWDWGTEYLLTALSLGLSLGLALCHPTMAVSFLTSLLFLRPWELIEKNDYFTILPKLSFSICIAHVLLLLVKRPSKRPNGGIDVILLASYAFWTFVTTFKSPDPVLAQGVYYETFFKSCFLYFMISNALEKEEDLATLQGTIVLTFLGVGLVSIYQTVLISTATNGIESRLKGIGAFSNSNDIAALMVLVIPFALMTLLRKKEGLFSRFIAGASLLCFLICIYMSQSRGAMLALVLSLGLYVVLKIRSRWLTIGFSALAITTLLVYFQFSTRQADDLQESSASRITYIKTGLIMGLKNPVLGVGFESYEVNFEKYATEILYEWGHRTAHNSWILAFAETGIIGLILFVTLFWIHMKQSLGVFHRSPQFLLALVGYSVAISFLSHTYLLYPYLLFGLIGVAHRIEQSQGVTL